MVLANGMAMGMHGVGFGLGFLNLIGTILFIVFAIWVVKYAVRGFRTSGRGPWEWRGSGSHRHGSHRHGSHRHGSHGPWGERSDSDHANGGHGNVDDAMTTARERLAKNEISPEEFETLKRGLKREEVQESPRDFRPDSRSDNFRGDSALATARMRFAQGEMSAEEFEAIKQALQS